MPDMHIWHAWVSCGRFLVRAVDREQAIALARESARQYDVDAMTADAGADLLSPIGAPHVFDADYS